MGDVPRGPVSSSRETAQNRDLFAVELMGLKRRGCCVLVTGSVSERVRAAQSRRLFGESDTSRQRILIFTEQASSPTAQYLPDGIPSTHPSVRILDYTDLVADMAGDISSSQQSLADVDPDTPESMTGLCVLLCDPVCDAVPSDSLPPGELRLGITTLGTLVETDGLSATRAFVRSIRSDILAANGMGHFHFPDDPDPELLAALDPVIDIHIELRQSDDVPEHRWHLLGTEHSTGWLRL
ncbi:DUF7504 family protein [Halocatena pleomorpha]|uniref:KaiC-like domain-containing protein n=1 Tax=Halocatena pleomorpha TaxID=1785090 RepID=A0A3P3REM4_9EURY|nr:hypothetical protein [Halocatena pleomorpha]RRJ31841.1 hypothetical protein EIK79_06135 [Halocatena pleomorpha]